MDNQNTSRSTSQHNESRDPSTQPDAFGGSPPPFTPYPPYSFSNLLQSGSPYHPGFAQFQQSGFSQFPPSGFSQFPQPVFHQFQSQPVPSQQPETPTIQTSDEIEELVPETQPQPSRRKGKAVAKKTGAQKTRATPWTNDEEVALAKSWIDVSEDPVTGNSQKKRDFWARVQKKFHAWMGREEYRNIDQLTSKWTDLNKKVTRFSAIYHNVSKNWRSGASDVDILGTALTRYREENNGHAFPHKDAWEVLKNYPRWAEIVLPEVAPRPSKRNKSSDLDEHTMSSDAHFGLNLNDDDDDLDDEPIKEPQRPIGRDKGKQKSSTSNYSVTKEDVESFIDQLQTFNNKTDIVVASEEKKWEAVKAKAEATKAKAEATKLMAEIKKQELEAKDYEFFMAPHDHLTGVALTATLNRKENIAKKYGWGN